jgi:hypothetical protein
VLFRTSAASLALTAALVGSLDSCGDGRTELPDITRNAGHVEKRTVVDNADPQAPNPVVVVVVRRDDRSVFRATVQTPQRCPLGSRYPACDAG